ncbi:MAG: hypothetical protein ACK56I_06320, partial [bacterium]
SWAGKRDEAEPGCVGASCELWCYLQQPTGAGIPGAREVGTKYRNGRRLTLRKNGIGGVKGDDGGAFAAHETATKLGCMRPPPGRLGQVSEKGEVNRNPTCWILSSKPGSS